MVTPAAVVRVNVRGRQGRCSTRSWRPATLMRPYPEGPASSPTLAAGIDSGSFSQHVDRAVHGIRAVERAAGAAQHLDRVGLLGVDLEHFVDVAEADWADRHAVLEEQERAAGAGARQHRRPDRGEALLAAAALDHRARHAVQHFGAVRRADERDGLGVDAADADGCRKVDTGCRAAVTTISSRSSPAVGTAPATAPGSEAPSSASARGMRGIGIVVRTGGAFRGIVPRAAAVPAIMADRRHPCQMPACRLLPSRTVSGAGRC